MALGRKCSKKELTAGLDDFMLEAIPEGPTLLLRNHDESGVVGMVCM